MKSVTRAVLYGVLSIMAGTSLVYAQTNLPDRSTTIDPETERPIPNERFVVEDRGIRERVIVEERAVERIREGELYVAGF